MDFIGGLPKVKCKVTPMLSKDYILEVTPENLLDNSQGELEALLK